MTGAWKTILARHGQRAKVCRAGGEVPVRAFVQPVLEKGADAAQCLPTPLGAARQDRWLYLGDPAVSLEGLGDGWVEWNGMKFDVQAAQPVYVGSQLSHWWALMTVRDPDE